MWPFRRSVRPKITASAFTEELVQSTHRTAAGASPIQATAPPRQKFIACMVTHGMGQQVPFETVGLMAEALKDTSFQANRVRLTEDGDLLSRLECAYTDPDGTQVQVHLYEGYWAPLTEGKIGFWETIAFLYAGGLAGLRSLLRRAGRTKFTRWMFGDVRDLPVKPGTFTDLLLVLMVVTCGVLAYAALVKVLVHIPAAFAGRPPLFGAHVLHLLRLWLLFAWHHVKALLLVVVALVYTKLLHFAVVEYVGDVAIYVSSHKVSRFEEVRTAIQKTIFSTAEQIYSAARNAAGEHLYDEVVLVGHSLGSVITYDLLNELIVWDQKACAGRQNVVGRTGRLITFGSPLEKTAFLFRSQVSPDHHYREALACLLQPLILTYAVRPRTFRWYNIYSAADIISGKLVYYDDPSTQPPNPVINLHDPNAWIPLLAHIQYWTGDVLADVLREALFGAPFRKYVASAKTSRPVPAPATGPHPQN